MCKTRLLCMFLIVIVAVSALGSACALQSSTLRNGDRGQDVRSLQHSLIRLGFLSGSADGVFGPKTEQAVRSFQQSYHLTVDGLAGRKTLAAIEAAEKGQPAAAASAAVSAETAATSSAEAAPASASPSPDSSVRSAEPSASGSSAAGSALFGGDYSVIRLGDRGARVKTMQQALIALGCLSGKADGVFGKQTLQAVYRFQHRQKLTEDGVAGRKTLSAMERAMTDSPVSAASASPAPAVSETEKEAVSAGESTQINPTISGPDQSSIRLLHWFKDIKPSLKNGDHLLVYDPASGLSWTLRVMSRGRHCDSEPLTRADTDTMVKAFGGNTWTQKGVYVRLPSGVWTVAATHDMPHLSGTISDNGFDGHLCVHFLRDMAEAQANDPNYGVSNQKTIRALWLKISGQELDY